MDRRRFRDRLNPSFYINTNIQHGNVNYDAQTRQNQVLFVADLDHNIPVYSVAVYIYDAGQQTEVETERGRMLHVDYVMVKLEKKVSLLDNSLDEDARLYLAAATKPTKQRNIFQSVYDQLCNLHFNVGPSDVSVIVWDLDDTLVNYELEAFDCVPQVLRYTRRLFDYQVLWSHGAPMHVRAGLLKNGFDDNLFDTIITRNPILEKLPNKGLGMILRHLNDKFGVQSIKFSVLVDDTDVNYANDYDYFVHVPRPLTSPWIAFMKPHLAQFRQTLYHSIRQIC